MIPSTRLRYFVKQLRFEFSLDEGDYYVFRFFSDTPPSFHELRLTAKLLSDLVPIGFAITPNHYGGLLFVIACNGLYWSCETHEPTFVISIGRCIGPVKTNAPMFVISTEQLSFCEAPTGDDFMDNWL